MFLGFLGIHRFYLGYTLIGIIQFLTGGGFLIWMIVDFVRLITGSLRPVDWEDFDEIFFGSEWMETQLKHTQIKQKHQHVRKYQKAQTHTKHLIYLFIFSKFSFFTFIFYQNFQTLLYPNPTLPGSRKVPGGGPTPLLLLRQPKVPGG